MLKIIIGRARSGKTARIFDEIRKLTENKTGGILLIVPEQFSHEAERELCRVCGNSVSLYAEVLSFTRLYNRVLPDIGGMADKTLDKGGRILLMDLALRTAAPQLKVYSLGRRVPEFLNRLMETKDEFKAAGVGYETLIAASERESGALADKMRDLAVIFDTYDSLIPEGICDPYDRLDRLAEGLGSSDVGRGAVYIDGFTDFTAQEMSVVEKLLEKCDDMTVCMTCDDITGIEPQFEPARQTIARLYNMANKHAKQVKLITVEAQETDKLESLDFIEKHLFSDEKPEFSGSSDGVRLFTADTPAWECEIAAATALSLVRDKGCRWRDITVAASDWSSYSSVAPAIFEKYGVPVYIYDKEDIMQKPVMTLITSALDVISGGWEYYDVFRYLKTGMTGMDIDSRDLLENYVYRWNIRGEKMWSRDEDWSASPRGFDGHESENDTAVLETVNRLRRDVASPIYRLSRALRRSKSAFEMVSALYDFTEDVGLYDRINERRNALIAEGDLQSAAEYAQLWQVLVTALEQCAEVLGGAEMDVSEFTALFKLLLSQYEIGTIPISVDTVGIGDMTRMRRRQIKHMIVIGASDEKMPAFAPPNGVLSDVERDRLSDMGIELSNTSHLRLSRQMNAVYTSLTLPSETLTVTFSDNGGESRPSFVFTAIENLLNIKSLKAGAEIKKESLLPCFELAASGESAAYAYFESDPEWSGRLGLVRNAARIPRGTLSVAASGKLYSKDINVTASRVDRYYNCKFSYFMQYGLGAKPREEARFEAPEAGTFVHYILENTTREITESGGFSLVDGEDIERIVRKNAEKFIEDSLDGFKDKTKRFIYLFNRLVEDAVSITQGMAEELKNSDFTPLEFELDFSKRGDMPPADVRDEDGHVTVSGKVDRVDGWVKDGKLYLKVVDYKTGRKQFSLSDVLYGIGLQMLIYLFVLQKEGKIRYDKEIVPAGVLYMPAREIFLNASRSSSEEAIERERAKGLRRHGLLLSDEDVIEALEHGKEPKYIPVKFGKDGMPTGDSIADIEQFGALSRHIDRLLLEMGGSLRRGDISAEPYYKSTMDNACVYCDYYEACRFGEDKNDRRKYASKLKSIDAWKEIYGKEDER